ncbi:MAG: NAD-glutamate dehydrogenase, partial [Steroidobacteraceae bacterium]|nr:NAD-glutamate dehydrogenase [Steroidobacteraceae bacterium]
MQVNVPAARLEIIERVATHAATHSAKRLAVPASALVHAYYRGVGEEDLAARSTDYLWALAQAHLAAGSARAPGAPLVRVFNPDPVADGFASPHTLVLVVTDDMPFLVDSVGLVVSQCGLATHFIVHPILSVRRDARGRLLGLPDGAESTAATQESWQLFEVDRETDPARLEALRLKLLDTLDDVRCATSDWMEMRRRARAITAELEAKPPRLAAGQVDEARALLEFMEDNHFTFLGYREYRLRRGATADLLEPVADTGLGILRPGRRGHPLPKATRLTGEVRDYARSQDLLIITKANSVSTIHRGTYLDYVGIKTFDSRGRVTGERRFLGLWTSTSYGRNPREVPVLRHKVQQVISHFGLSPTSHDGKAVMHVLENYPRDELFQASVDDLIRIARGVVNLYERSQVRMFLRRDAFRRFYSCLIFVPRDRYSTAVRQRIESIAREALGGIAIESQVQMSDSSLARVNLRVHTDPSRTDRVDLRKLEADLAESVRTWQDRFKDALLQRHEEGAATRLYRAYAQRFPAAYVEDATAAIAVDDVEALESVQADASGLRMSLSRTPGQPASKVQFKLFRRGRPIPISDVLPTMENMGLRLISERPYEIDGAPESLWIQDFELEHPGGVDIDLEDDGPRFMDTFANVWLGNADNDGFNRLVLAADLTWREAMLLRTYGRWLLQLGVPFSQSYMEQVLASNAQAAAHLAGLFVSRFDPRIPAAKRNSFATQHQQALDTLLAAVTRADDDRILRSLRAAIDGTVRTNFFQPGADGNPKPYISIKLEPRRIPDTPLPRPLFEIYMHSPRVEGVHLRMGKVARGGLRWSDRREDFRTEVLGLMKAQNVKNTLIVPVGAKGGFVPRRLPTARDEVQREGTECYRIFIRSLLDITDNIVGGKLVPPRDVVRHDADDPYLVVAADKGTASFSDVANAISLEYGHWLGDAFASGGSAGYDHKKMGITAKGGWESVKRHFREMGIDTQTQDFTVVGIGDMAGDVFGNGMLLSPHTRLLAAFNHVHIFLDPA